MTSDSTTNINSNDLNENCIKGIDASRKNFSYTFIIIIITFGVMEIIAIFSYCYIRNKYHIHIFDHKVSYLFKYL
jgi:hypothetical protein